MTPEQNELIDRHRSYAFERGMVFGLLIAAAICAAVFAFIALAVLT